MSDLTFHQQIVLGAVEDLARRGAPIPPLSEMQEQIGVELSTISSILMALDRKRIIDLKVVRTKGAAKWGGEKGRIQRQVTILRTGESTAPICEPVDPWSETVEPNKSLPCFRCGCRVDACMCGSGG